LALKSASKTPTDARSIDERTGLTQEQRVLRARAGAYAQAAAYDPLQTTTNARKNGPGNNEYWLPIVDPNGELPERERVRRAVAAKKLHFTRLALKSSQARRKPAAPQTEPSPPVSLPRKSVARAGPRRAA